MPKSLSCFIKLNHGLKKTSSKFDINMGSFNGAETCELVGSMISTQLSQLCGNSVSLYRDYGLAIYNKTSKIIEIIKKNVSKIFGKYDLKVSG